MPEIIRRRISTDKELLLAMGRILQDDTAASRRALQKTLERYEKELADAAEHDKWRTWLDATLDAVSETVAVWSTQVKFVDVTINSVIATGQPGTLNGPDLNPTLRSLMVARNIPDNIADKLAKSIAALWADWQSSVTIPGLPWYPAFAAFPGSVAPPTPNTPSPLITLSSTALASVTDSRQIYARLEAELGAPARTEAAAASLEHFAQLFSMRFFAWCSGTMVHNVLGTGPVPSFAPPYVPVGPVVNGHVIAAPGVLVGRSF